MNFNSKISFTSCQSMTVSGSSLWRGLLAFHLQTALISSHRSRVSKCYSSPHPEVNYDQNVICLDIIPASKLELLLTTKTTPSFPVHSFKMLLSVIKKGYSHIPKRLPKSRTACPQQDAIHLPNTAGCSPRVLEHSLRRSCTCLL